MNQNNILDTWNVARLCKSCRWICIHIF